MDPILDSLTPAQREAVEHIDGPLLVLAGPGSGKTRVVTHRIAHLLRQGIPPRQILALTFTNKSADEMRDRLEALVPGEPVWMSTFHRLCSHLLRRHARLVGIEENFTIYDADDSRQVLRRVMEEGGFNGPHVSAERVAATISRIKNDLSASDELPGDAQSVWQQVAFEVYPLYQARLLASGAVDFDDLLLHVAVMLRDNPDLRSTLNQRYQYVLVDEYQDTNRAQYAILRGLSADHSNLAATGDPDQSIYGWRGANLNNILDFEADFDQVRVVRLEQNWRSTKRILQVADQLISYNRRRKHKVLTTENGDGKRVQLTAHPTQAEEAEQIACLIAEQVRRGERRPHDFAVFYRINALSRTFEMALSDQGVPYQLVHGVEFYQRKEVKDVLAFAQLFNNPRNDVAFMRIANVPPRGIGKKTLQRIQSHANRHGLSLLESARQSGLIPDLLKRAAVQVAKFVTLIDQLHETATDSVEGLLGHVLERTGYRDLYEGSDLEIDLNRLANIEELLTDARQFDEQHAGERGLEEYLERTSLVNDVDDWDVESDKVTLMTLHAAKGLEFPVVFLVALEDGILPHERSRRDPEQLEEERRLLFVGITRAAEELQLSYAARREFRGQRRTTIPSSFLMELPREAMELTGFHQPVYPSHTEPRNRLKSRVSPAERATPATITTAAELVGHPTTLADGVSPEDYRQGMAVVHPEFGPGKIIALQGAGDQRNATVAFATCGQKQINLNGSRLRPTRTR